MNFYPRYPGDYIAATLHLSMQQDGAYNRLLDWYYTNERPIPHASRYAIARATSKREQADVDAVLSEFFVRESDAWAHVRAGHEISRAKPAIEAARNNGKRGGRPRKPQRDPREENPPGFQTETQWDAQRGTQNEPSTKAPQNQNQIDNNPTQQAPDITGGTLAGRACRLMREAGCQGTNPSHPELLAALDAGVTPEDLAATAREGVEAGKARPFAWACITARCRHQEGPRTITANGTTSRAPSWQAQGVGEILGENAHDLTEIQPTGTLVRGPDPAVPRGNFPAQPRRLASG